MNLLHAVHMFVNGTSVLTILSADKNLIDELGYVVGARSVIDCSYDCTHVFICQTYFCNCPVANS